MQNHLVLIRCTEDNQRLRQLVDEISLITRGDSSRGINYQVFAVPDRMQTRANDLLEDFSSWPVSVLPLTADFLEEKNLHHYDERERTGWACGDYVLYRAMHLQWEFAWVIEPDVFLMNGAEEVFKSYESSSAGLLATHIVEAENGWIWKKPIQKLIDDKTIFAMAFPLVRCSREVVANALETRQSMTAQILAGAATPNDESVIATVAHEMGVDVIDLKRQRPDVFRYWSTVLRFPMRDIRQRESGPLIVHSGLEHREYLGYLVDLWRRVELGSKVGRDRLLKATNVASPETTQTFIDIVTRDMLNRAKPNH